MKTGNGNLRVGGLSVPSPNVIDTPALRRESLVVRADQTKSKEYHL